MKSNVKDIQRRTIGYWFDDGLVDLFVGGIFLLLAIFFALSGLLQAGFLTALTVAVGQPLIILVGFLLGKKVIPILKERFIYPRTGYVAYRERSSVSRARRIVIALVSGAVTSATLLLVLPNLGENLIWLISGIMIAAFMVFLSLRTGLIRYLVLAGIAILSGAIVSVIGITSPFQAALFYGLFGIAWLIQGAVSLTGYLRKNSNTPIEEE